METKLVYKNIFTDADCDWISQESKNVLDISNAITGEGDDGKVSSFRKSQTGFISYNNQDHADLWNYVSNALWNVVNDANRTNFGFDVSFLDSIQYTIYNEGGDHYDWHMDTFLETPNAYHRKLSVTVQLSNSNEYTGGDFELNDGGVIRTICFEIKPGVKEYSNRNLLYVVVNSPAFWKYLDSN